MFYQVELDLMGMYLHFISKIHIKFHVDSGACFDESKNGFRYGLSSDLPEIQLIREYELLMSNYDEASQSKLETIMTEMDALNAWKSKSGQNGSFKARPY